MRKKLCILMGVIMSCFIAACGARQKEQESSKERLGGKTVLYMLDALICATSEGASITEETARWRQAPFDGNYTSSVFVSQDPVASDSVGADFLINEPAVTEHNGALKDNPNVENYLHEAGLVEHAPSGNVYDNGKKITYDGKCLHLNFPYGIIMIAVLL